MSSIVVLDSGIDPREKQKSGRIEKQEAVAKTIADEKKKKAASGKTNYQAVKKAIGQKHTSKNEAYFSRKELEELANKLISPEEDSTVVELKKQLEVSQDEIKRLKQQLEEKEIELLASPTNGALLIIAKAYEGYKKEKPKATQGDFFNKVVADSSIRGLSIGTFNNLIKEGTFPQSKKIGLRAVGWNSQEVQSWIEEKLNGGAAQ